MFRVIGGALVYGMALYGAVMLFTRQKMKVVSPPGDRSRRRGAVDVAADSAGTTTVDQVSEASTEPVPTGST